MKNTTKRIGAILLAAMMLLAVMAGCASEPDTAPSQSGGDTTASSGQDQPSQDTAPSDVATGEMTAVGTPRNETLIIDMWGGAADPMSMNPYLEQSCVPLHNGIHALVYTHLWEVDMSLGKMVPSLAANDPEDISGNGTKFRFNIREGIKWSDGVDLTAEDVIFTHNMIANTPELTYSGRYNALVKSMTAIDSHTIEVETVNPEMRLSDRLGAGYTNDFKVVPKHIWENEDPTTFQNSWPVSSGPYILKDRDTTAGNWFLYELRDDWQNTDVGQITGKAGPKYILYNNFGSEERKIMAVISNEMDIMYDISPESWEILNNRSDYARAWYSEFPYATLEDCCARGISLNCALEPFDNADVRWALILATDIASVSLSTFSGMMRVTPINAPPIEAINNAYIMPMQNWLRDFELSDGYKPYDESYAATITDLLSQQGIEGLPQTEAEQKELFGYGWWRYDTAQATKMLEANGFSFDDGKWYLPDGSLWTIIITAPADFEVQSMRLAFAVAESWKKFGIDAQIKQVDNATFWNSESIGDFEAGAYWPACGNKVDTVMDMSGWDPQYVTPLGQPTAGGSTATTRYNNARIGEIFAELDSVQASDPRLVELMTELYQELVTGMPFIPMFGTTKFVPTGNYYFDGYPNSDNPYAGPWWWWSNFRFVVPEIYPTGN